MEKYRDGSQETWLGYKGFRSRQLLVTSLLEAGADWLALTEFEECADEAWPSAADKQNLYRAYANVSTSPCKTMQFWHH